MPPGFAAQQGPVGPTEGIPGRQYKQKSREIYGFLALVPPLLWTNFGIHDLYACRYKQAFIHMGLNASTWFLFYRLKEAEKRLDNLWIFASSSDINDRDTIVFLFVASALISIVWRFIECFTVKVDGRGVPMKNGKSIFSSLKIEYPGKNIRRPGIADSYWATRICTFSLKMGKNGGKSGIRP